jgi:hypothetical protein
VGKFSVAIKKSPYFSEKNRAIFEISFIILVYFFTLDLVFEQRVQILTTFPSTFFF